MRISTRMLFVLALLVAVLVFMLTGPSPAAHRQQPFASAAGRGVSVQLPDRRLDVSAPAITPALTAGDVQASVTVTVTNTGTHAFGVQPDDFTLSAEGDTFGQGGTPGSTGTLTGTVGPGVSRTGQLTFVVPRAALPELTLLYHAQGLGLVASIPLGGAGTTPDGSTPTPSATPGAAVSVASDTFNRMVSNGWGSADAGGGWLILDTLANWSVAPGAGSITVSAGGEERAYLSSVAVQDGEILAKVVLPRSTQSNNCLAYVLGRFTGGSTATYYRVGLGQGAGRSTIILRAQRSDGTFLSPDLDTGIAAADGAVVWLRVQFEGTNPTAIRAHAWADGTTEPTAWTLTTTDANAAEQVAGAVGVRARNEDSATAHTFTFANFQVTPRQRATATPTPTGNTIQHYLYVFPDREMDVYNMDNNHSLVQRFSLPTRGLVGVAASPATGRLYFSECGNACNGSGTLLEYSLITNTVMWTVTYPFGVDSMAITPDGKTIYMPDGAGSTDGLWHVLDAATGHVIGNMQAGVGGHDTSVSVNGAHVYLGGYQNGPNSTYLQVADTATNTITKKIGPLVNGVRPFTINGKETLAFTTASNYLGFQVSSITTTQVLYKVPISRFTWTTFVSTAPSHGISLSPDEKEVYVMDGPNDYVHVFDVSGLPGSPPKQVADIRLTPMTGNESPCAYRCEKEGWLLHSRDGRFVYVGDSGDVIATATRKIVATLGPLANTRKFLEIDWQNGVPVFTTSRHGLGYLTNSVSNVAVTSTPGAVTWVDRATQPTPVVPATQQTSVPPAAQRTSVPTATQPTPVAPSKTRRPAFLQCSVPLKTQAPRSLVGGARS